MVVPQTVEYALRAVAWLAQNPGHPQTTQQLSDATQVSASYLPKVLAPLIKAGLVSGQRGLHGGYSLETDPADLTVLAVVDCIDPIRPIDRCPLGLSTHGARLCPLHRMLREAAITVQQRFAATTIAGLISDAAGQDVRPLCESASSAPVSLGLPKADSPPDTESTR